MTQIQAADFLDAMAALVFQHVEYLSANGFIAEQQTTDVLFILVLHDEKNPRIRLHLRKKDFSEYANFSLGPVIFAAPTPGPRWRPVIDTAITHQWVVPQFHESSPPDPGREQGHSMTTGLYVKPDGSPEKQSKQISVR